MGCSYESLTEMWADAGSELLDHGDEQESRNGSSLELLGWSGTLNDIEQNFVLDRVRKADPAYAAAELLWYFSESSNVDMLLPYAPQYKNFAEDSGRAYGAYGPRMMSSILKVISLFKEHPTTRQAVAVIWQEIDLNYAHMKKDIPCTVCLQFFLRRGELHCIAYMRSNDVWLGMPYDVWSFTMIQRFVADALGVEYGQYHHHVGSLHLYDKDREGMRNALASERSEEDSGLHCWSDAMDHQSILHAIQIEKENRELGSSSLDSLAVSTAECDLAICCVKKWPINADMKIHSPILAQAWELRYDTGKDVS